MNPDIIILVLIAIVVLLIGFGGSFSREHYIYSGNEPIKKKEKKSKKSLFYLLEDCENTESEQIFAPYHSSLENTVNTLYDC
jgi:hypothetical protein